MGIREKLIVNIVLDACAEVEIHALHTAFHNCEQSHTETHTAYTPPNTNSRANQQKYLAINTKICTSYSSLFEIYSNRMRTINIAHFGIFFAVIQLKI